jgi:ParB family chromosome partitioning protein
MTGKAKGGLGRGLGALIPQGPPVSAPAAPPIAESVAADLRASTASTSSSPSAAPTASATAAVTGPSPATTEPQLAPVPGARFAELHVDSITPNARQPRQIFDQDALEELKVSIQEVGFLQPIVVREAGSGSYELVMGERRWRAAQALGLDVIPAIVRDTRTTPCSGTPCWRTSTEPT